MSDDVLQRLRCENPVPGRMPALPIERVLARLDDLPATDARRSARSPRGARRVIRAVPLTLSMAVVVAVVAVALTAGGHGRPARLTTHPAAPPAKPNNPLLPNRGGAPHLNPFQIARANARDTPTQLFESPSLRSMGPGSSTGPETPTTPYPETVIPSTVRELGTFSLAGVGVVQFWTADTQQHGVCAALRLPDGVWAGLQKGGTQGGAMSGCQPTRSQIGKGALIIDGFDYITSDVIGREGQRWLLAYGAVSVPQAVARVRDTHSKTNAAIITANHFAIALHPVGNDWGDFVHLQAFDASAQPIATQGKPLPGTLTTKCVGRYDVRRERIPGTHRFARIWSCRKYEHVLAK